MLQLRQNADAFSAHLTKWTRETTAKFDDVQDTFNTNISRGKGTQLHTRQEAKSLRQVITLQANKAKIEKEKLEEFQLQVNALKEKTKESKEGNLIKKEIFQKERQKAKLEADIKGFMRRTEENEESLAKGIMFFKRYLGLEIESISGVLQIKFRLIDPSNPEKEFYLNLMVDENDQYRVQDCVPPIKDIDKLEAEANKTDSFALFIHQVRKRFQGIALSSSTR